MATIVLTALGDDRPGLVEALSAVIARHGGSWRRSHMARLGGKFAGIVEVSVPDRARTAILADLEPLRHGTQLEITVELAGEPPVGTVLETVRLTLDLVGSDRPGIVHEISAALAADAVSIVELETGTSSAPMAGESLFTARAELDAPAGLALGHLRATLEALANELMVDLDLSPSDEGSNVDERSPDDAPATDAAPAGETITPDHPAATDR